MDTFPECDHGVTVHLRGDRDGLTARQPCCRCAGYGDPGGVGGDLQRPWILRPEVLHRERDGRSLS